jgi:uncharacterized protein (DUF2336 family)
MTDKTRQLENLVRLAEEQSSDGRRELLREITDLFVDNQGAVGDKESSDFATIIGQLVLDVEMDVRKHVAEQLCSLDNAPRDVVTMLANDEIDVARPMLENSPVLKNADLIKIVKERSQSHLATVAGRPEVNGDVADALVENGDDQVLETLVSNQGATLTRAAAATVIARSETNTSLQEPLVSRSDLPPDLVNQMYFWVSDQLRERILSETQDLDESLLDGMLKDAQSSVIHDLDGDPGAAAAPSDAEKFIRRKLLLKQLDAALLVELMRDGRKAEFLEGFARLAGLDNETVDKILSDKSQQALAIACKACGIESNDFTALARLIGDERGDGDTNIFEVIQMYEKIPMVAVQRTMRFWRVRQAASESAEA